MKIRRDVLPIPVEHFMVHVDWQKVRKSATYRRHARPFEKVLVKAFKGNAFSARLGRVCNFEPLRDVHQFWVAYVPDRRGAKRGIGMLRGSFDAARLVACARQPISQQKVTVRELRLGSLSGLGFSEPSGWSAEVWVYDRRTILVATGVDRTGVREVLTGRRRSISQLAIFKDTLRAGTGRPVAMVVAPSMVEATRKIPLPLFKQILAAGLWLDLPGGGVDARGLVAFLDPQKAQAFARSAPLLLGMMATKLPQSLNLARSLTIRQDPEHPQLVHVSLRLDSRATGVAVGLVLGAGKSPPGGAP